jgi:hypothetical protein
LLQNYGNPYGGDRNQPHGQSAAAPVLTAVPLGGRIGEARRCVCSSALPSRRGAGSSRLAAQRKAGAVQPRSVLLSVAALTGPPTAAQTGIPMRPLVCEPGVAWTPRRPRLGGVCDGAAVDDGGVGPRPARPNDPAALCRGCSGAEPTACRSGMAQMTPRMCKARNGVAHGHRSTEARGMPAGSRPTYGQSYTFEKSECPLYPFPHNTLSSDYLYISIEYLL